MHSLSRVAAVVMSSSWQQCKYNCIVIGKRVKSDTMSVDNVRKVNHIQHEQYWAKDWVLWHRADDINNRLGTTGVHDSVCPTGQMNGTTSKLFHARQIDARVTAAAARGRQS